MFTQFNMKALLLAVGGGLCLGPVAGAVQEVGVGKTHATIQAAINASAGPGDDVVVYSGTYAEGLLWHKVVNIVEAPGETAILAGGPAGHYYIDCAGGGARTWDGIDISLTTNAPGIIISGTPGLVMKNFNATVGSGYAGPALGFVTPTSMTLQSVNIDFTPVLAALGIIHRQGGGTEPITFLDGTMVGRGLLLYNASSEGELHIVNSTVRHSDGGPAGSEYMTGTTTAVSTTTLVRSLYFKNSHVIGNDHSIGLGLDNVNVTGEESVFEFRGTSASINAPRKAGWRHEFTNCAWLFDSTVGNPFVVYNPGDGGPGTLVFRNSTMTVRGAGIGSAALLVNMNDAFNVDITVQNSILNMPTSGHGLVNGTIGSGSVQTAGINLRSYAATATNDQLGGTRIDADPLLQADGYHLAAGSPALDAGQDIGVTTDIDGDARPLGLSFDLGADEAVPILAVRSWSLY